MITQILNLLRAHRRTRLSLSRHLVFTLILLLRAPTNAQPLNDHLNDDQYLRNLIELRQPEALEQYIRTNPPANDLQRAQYNVARERVQLSRPNLAAGERAQIVDRLIAARRALIDAAAANDSRRPVWMADLATELLFDSLSVDGAGLTSLFGLPAREQRERAAAVAHEVLALSQSAEAQLAQTLLNLESEPNVDQNFALQQLRRELIERERQRRIPFLRGIGLVLNAEFNLTDSAAKHNAYSQAADTLTDVLDRLQGAPAITAQYYLGLAQARLGQFDQAEAHFAAVAKNPSATSSDIFAARMGGVINRTARQGPQSGLEALQSIESRYSTNDPANVFFRVLLADHRFLLRARIAGEAAPEQQQQLAAKTFESYIDLLNIDIAGTSPHTLRALALSRIAMGIAHLPNGLLLEQLPPIVRIAHADHLARQAHTREQAIIALEHELKNSKLTAPDRAAALFMLGKAMLDQGHHLFAAQRFIELARDLPGESQSESAIEIGLSLAADLHQNNPNDAQVRAALHDGIKALLEKYPNLRSIDRWRYSAGQLAMAERRFDDAAILFSQIAPDAEQWLDANFMQAAVAHAQAAAGDAAQSNLLNEKTLGVIDRVAPILENALPQISDAKRAAAARYYIVSLRIMRAEALIALNRAQQALDVLAGIESDPVARGEAVLIGQALNARISAYQKMNKPEAALQDLTRVFETSPDQAPQVIAPMLEALSRDVRSLMDQDRQGAAVDLASRTLLPVADLLHTWLESRGTTADIERFALPLTEAYRLSGKCHLALQWHDQLSASQSGAADAIISRAECLYALGGDQHLADAISLHKRIIAAGPSAAGREHYWLSHLRTLQILDRVNRRTEQIMPQIERLKLEDPTYGGERFRRGFDALRIKYAN